MDIDWGDLYLEHVADVAAMVGDLDDERLAQKVPGTPEWTIQQVVAHLAGGAADGLTGRTEGAPGPTWTERHVAERDDVALAGLIAELRGNAEEIAAGARTAKVPAVVWDIATHHADLHEALGRGRISEHLWAPIVAFLGPRRAEGVVGQVDDYELFRALFSRRSRSQMAAWGTDASPERLDEIPVFGPRDDDQPIPE